MNKQYVYGCISTVKVGFNDAEAIKRTKAYQEALDTIEIISTVTGAAISEDNIFIDVITASYRFRKKLNQLLGECDSEDTIILFDISALGFTTDEIKENYSKIFKADIGILIPDSSEKNQLSIFSTVDFNYTKTISYTEEELNSLCAKIAEIKVTTRQGRIKTVLPFPEHFEEVYWAFENFFIDERTTLSNQYFSMPKRRFYEFCQRYEQTPEYLYAQEEQDKLYGISYKPKRFGKVPEYFPILLQELENGLKLAESCVKLNISVISEIDFKRFKIKYNEGKSNKRLLSLAARENKPKNDSGIYNVLPEARFNADTH